MLKNNTFGLAVALMLAAGAAQVRADYTVISELWEPEHPSFEHYINIRSIDNEMIGLSIVGRYAAAYSGSTDVLVAAVEGFVSNLAIPGGGNVVDSPYALRVHLTDADSGESGAVTFQGTISALVVGGGGVGVLKNPSGTFGGPATQSLLLGANFYEVSLPPSFASSGNLSNVNITAHIAVNPPRPVDAPEPSSLALVGTAFGAIALIRRRPATRS